MKIDQRLIDEVRRVAASASERILEVYDTKFTVDQKDNHSPLTLADTAANEIICRELKLLTPDIPVLSEETETQPFSVRRQWPRYWLIDPLDGTREFIKRNGEFTVNIALIERDRPQLGVVFVPVTKVCYHAARALGAFKTVAGGAPVAVKTTPTVAGKLTLITSRSHADKKTQAFIDRVGEAELISVGSSLKFCLVAEGKGDIYPRFGPTSEWDTAAAQCIVEEAGGHVLDMNNFQPLLYNTKESLLNPEFVVLADRRFDWKQYFD